MREISRRPALLLLIALVGGLTLLDGWPALALPMGAVWLAPGLGWRIAAAGAFLLGIALAPRHVAPLASSETFVGDATVASIPELRGARQFCEIETEGELYFLTSPSTPVLAAGDQINIAGTKRPLLPGRPGSGSTRLIRGAIAVDAAGIKVVRYGAAIFRAGVAWRDRFVSLSRRQLEPEAAAALNALCFNVTADLSSETYANLRRTGTIHIISASGLHVLIFAWGLQFVFGLLPIPRGWQLAIIGVVLATYAVGAGMRPPVVRAVAMASVLGMASILRREPDLLSALAASASGYLIWKPVSVYDIGFQLSFAAVASLALFAGVTSEMPKEPLRRLLAGARDLAKASLVATIGTAPLTAYYFGSVSLISVPANLAIALVLAPITLTAFAAQTLFEVIPTVSAALLGIVVEPLVGWVLAVVNSLGPLPISSASVPAFSAYWMIPYFGAMLLFWRPIARPA